MKRQSLPLLAALFLFAACNSNTAQEESPAPQKVLDYAYGSEPIVPGTVEEIPAIREQQPTYFNPGISLRNLFRKLEKPSDVFKVDAGKDVRIKGKEGTTVSFKAHSLVYKGTNEQVKGEVQVRLKEFYTTEDILLADLSTSSKGRLIETGGMIYIEAKSKGRECALAEGTSVDVEFPVTDGYKYGMETFYGEWSDDNVDWVPAAGGATLEGLPASTVAVNKPLMLATASQEDLWPYVKETSRYPFSSLIAKDTGTVYVSFEIDEDLKPIRPLIEASLTTALDKAAHFIVANIPRWAAADTIPNAMDYRYLVPISFQLPRDLIASNYEQARMFERALSNREVKYSPRAVSRMGVAASLSEMTNWATTYNENVMPATLSSYLLSSSRLGWINCDRWRPRQKRTDFLVGVPAILGADVKMVFHNEKAFLGGRQSGDKVLFSAVPVNAPVTIVAMRAVGDEAYLATGMTNTSAADGMSLKFEKVTLDQVKERLKSLNEI